MEIKSLERFSQRLNPMDELNTRGIAPPCGDRNEFRSTLRRQRAARATRQTWTRVNVSENCDKHARNRPSLRRPK